MENSSDLTCFSSLRIADDVVKVTNDKFAARDDWNVLVSVKSMVKPHFYYSSVD